jgi:Na+/H+-dicarboxylate symporter
MSQKKKIGLLAQVVVAIALGALIGSFAPDFCIRLLNTFRSIFGQFIKFIVPLIVIGLVTPAIADTGKGAGKMLLLTMSLAVGSTVFAGYFSYFMSSTVLEAWIDGGFSGGVDASKEFLPYFTLKIPPVADVVTSLVLSFMLGLGIVATNAEKLAGAFSELRSIVTLSIQKAFVPLLPVYVLSVVSDLTACGKLTAVAGPCVKIMASCMLFTTLLLVLIYSAASIITRRNPFKAMYNMLPAYLMGWGSCSSAATIPVTLRQTLKNGVSRETAELVVPLCASVHLPGSMCNVIAYSAGVTLLYGGALDFGAYTECILMLTVVAVAAPGVPGGVVLASASILESALGFTPERYAVLVAMYMALDGMGTACNLTGDGAIAMLVDKYRTGKVRAAKSDSFEKREEIGP